MTPPSSGRVPTFLAANGKRGRSPRGLVSDPEIRPADEPTGILDGGHVRRQLDLRQRVRHDRGLAIVMVTDDLDLAASAQGVVLGAGRMGQALAESPFGTVSRVDLGRERLLGPTRAAPVS